MGTLARERGGRNLIEELSEVVDGVKSEYDREELTLTGGEGGRKVVVSTLHVPCRRTLC